MRAVPFGGYARNEREGGGHAEPGVKCYECGSLMSLMVRAGGYHCRGICEKWGLLAPLPRPRRRKQVWAR